MLKRKIKAYLSHPIRGFMGPKATREHMEHNNRLAVRWSKELYRFFGINLEIYVPGEHDEFVLIAYLSGIIDEKEILDIDCTILERRDILLVADCENHLSNGMKIEIAKAKELGIPIYCSQDLSEETLEGLKKVLERL